MSLELDPELHQIRTLLESDNPKNLEHARTLTREILTKLTDILVRTLGTRQQLMQLIASSKRQSEAILQLDREYILLEHFKSIARELRIDEDIVTQFIWLITAAGKEAQRYILDRETVFVNESISKDPLVGNLLALTEVVAANYDTYGNEFSATRLMREYESARITEIAKKLNNKGLFIDIGCANGTTTELVARLGFKESVGYDISPAMIASAKKRPGRKGKYHTRNVGNGIPAKNNTVDFIVVNFGAASEISADVFPEIGRVLKVGGIAYLSFYNNGALINKWWQPGQTSIEGVKNPLCDILEVPIIKDGEVKTYKIYARGTNEEEVRHRAILNGLTVDSMESPGLLPSMLPPIFFRDEERIELARQYEQGHASVAPYMGPYLNVVVRK